MPMNMTHSFTATTYTSLPCHRSFSQSPTASVTTTSAGPKLPRTSEVTFRPSDTNDISDALDLKAPMSMLLIPVGTETGEIVWVLVVDGSTEGPVAAETSEEAIALFKVWSTSFLRWIIKGLCALLSVDEGASWIAGLKADGVQYPAVQTTYQVMILAVTRRIATCKISRVFIVLT